MTLTKCDLDLRVTFYVEGDVAFTVDIGGHAIHRI